jgi:hypothetical protein
MTLKEDHCRALATMSRFDVEVTLHGCRVTDDAAGAFVECLQSERGPVQLIECQIKSQILGTALEGKCRVTKLKLLAGAWSAAMAVSLPALANNRGLLDLELSN